MTRAALNARIIPPSWPQFTRVTACAAEIAIGLAVDGDDGYRYAAPYGTIGDLARKRAASGQNSKPPSRVHAPPFGAVTPRARAWL